LTTESDRQAAAPVGIALLGAAAFLVTADVRVITPLLRVIADTYGTDVGTTAVVVTAYALPYGLCQLLYGPLGDRIGKVRIMALAMLLFAGGTAAHALAPSLWALTLVRALTGAVAAAVIPMSLAYIGDTYPYQSRQAAIGQFLGAIALAQVLSMSLGGVVAELFDWRAIFLLYGVGALGVALLLLRAARRRAATERLPAAASGGGLAVYRQLLASPRARLVLGAVFLEGLFFFGAFSFLGAFLRDRYALSYLAIGAILSGFGVGSLLYTRLVRWFVRQLGEQRMIVAGGLLSGLAFLGLALLDGWWLAIPASLVLGLGYYLIHSTLQTRATELAPSARGTAVALFAFCLFSGQGLGAALLGALVDRPALGYTAALLFSGLAMPVLGVGIVLATRRMRARAAAPGALPDTLGGRQG
jgi:predicted MFS family arabinose efflux permease